MVPAPHPARSARTRATRAAFAAAWVLALCRPSHAQVEEWDAEVVQDWSGRPVVEIVFDPPLEEVEDPFEYFDIEPGVPFAPWLPAQMLERMWLTGKVAGAQVLGSEVLDGVRLTVRYELRVLLEDVDIEGNKRLSRKRILELVAYRPDMELYPETLTGFEETLHEEYALRGYPDASFLFEVEDGSEPGKVTLHLTVIEGVPYRIHDITVGYVGEDPLVGPLPLHEIANALELEPGAVYDQLRLRRGLEAIEEKLQDEGYLDAMAGPVETREDELGKTSLHIPVDPGPLILFEFEGADHLPRDALMDVIDPRAELPLSAALVEEMGERLVEHYRALGFIEASVLVLQEKRAGGDVLAYRFLVTEGDRIRVREIVFDGNTLFEGKELRKQILGSLYELVPYDVVFAQVGTDVMYSLFLSGDQPFTSSHAEGHAPSLAVWPPDWIYWAEAYEVGIDKIERMYISEGYLGVVVSEPAIKRDGNELVVTIRIDEGLRTFVDEVIWEGNQVVDALELEEATGIRVGEPFSGLGVKDAEAAVLEVYGDLGHRFATVATEVEFTEDTTGALVRYTIVEGPQVIVRKILVRGNGITAGSLIRDRIALEKGDVFSARKQQRSVENLQKLGIFSAVSIKMLEPDIVESEKAIVVEVTERKPQFLSLKAGASTAEGVRGSIEYAYRNLFGYALDFHFRVALNYRLFFVGSTQEFKDWYLGLPLLSQLERNIGVGLTVPHLPRVGNWMTLEVAFAHLRKNANTYGVTTNAFDGSILLTPGRRVNILLRSGVETSFIEANTEISDDPSSLPLCSESPPPCLNEKDKETLRIPQTDSPAAFVVTGGSFNLDLRDNPFNPTRGVSINASLQWVVSASKVGFTWYDPVLKDGEPLSAYPYRSSHQLKNVYHENAYSNFLKFYADVTGYIPLGTPRLVLMLHAGGGAVFRLPRHTHTFPDRFFYLGGSRSLRGFREESLCAQDEFEENGQCFYGGELMVIYKLELRMMLRGSVGLALFTDMGNVWHGYDDRYGTAGLEHWYHLFTNLRVTAGAGLRFMTPVGPINLDVGFLLNRRESIGEPIAGFHFSIGTF